MRIAIWAGFDRYSGYGNDACDMALTWQRLGYDVIIFPYTVQPGIEGAVAELLTKDPTIRNDLVVGFAPPPLLDPRAFAHLAPIATGWTMWERTPLLAEDMATNRDWDDPYGRTAWWSPGGPQRPGFADRLDLDLLVATCPDGRDAIAALDPAVPMAVCPNGVDPDAWPELPRSFEGRPFRFSMVGVLQGRKAVFAAIEAWELAHEMDPSFDAELVLKTIGPGLHPRMEDRYPGVKIITAAWPKARLLGLYRDTDVMVSTSRGEGNNKPAMEYMATGGPVMATAWGGHLNWLHESTGYPLPGKLTQPTAAPWRDFEVDVQATAETFLHCWRNPAEVRRKGRAAARFIRSAMSWEHVCEQYVRLAMAAGGK